MKATLLFTALLISLLAFGQNDTIEDVNLVVNVPDNNWKKAQMFVKGDTTPFTGVMVTYYPNTKVVDQAVQYTNGQNRNSWVRSYYKSGALESEYRYGDRMGVEHGKYSTWFESGQKEMEGEYNNGTMTGTWTYWSEDGNIERIEVYSDGVLEKRVK